MAFSQQYSTTRSEAAGLKRYVARVYQYMALGLGVTGASALLVASSALLFTFFFQGPMGYLTAFAPFIMAMVLGTSILRVSLSTAYALFLVYAAMMGVSLSVIFLRFTGESIIQVFFMSSALFLGMSVYGARTKRDLLSKGSFFFMMLWGLVIAGLLNMFLGNSMLQTLLSLGGVALFAGLTAYDVQNIRSVYFALAHERSEIIEKSAILGAFQLYLDMINIFINLLYLVGGRRSN